MRDPWSHLYPLRRRHAGQMLLGAVVGVVLTLAVTGLAGRAQADSWSAVGRTFHVSSATGSDAATGLEPERAWRTLSRAIAEELRPGDHVLLRRGDTWRENLKPRQSGTATSPILFGAYGTGERPRILGSVSRARSGWWTETGPSIWRTDGLPIDPGMIFHNGVGSRRVASLEALQAAWDWCFDAAAGHVYVRLDSNPGLHEVEIPQRDGVGFSGASHLQIESIEIAYARMGIGLWGATDWTIRDVNIHDVTVNAIQGNRGSKAIAVRGSILQDWAWQSLGAPQSAPESVFGYGIQVISSRRGWPPSNGWVIEGNHLRLVNLRNAGADATAINIDRGGHASSIAGNNVDGNRQAGGGGIMVWRPGGHGPTQIMGNTIRDVGAMGINVSELAVSDYDGAVQISHNSVLHVCALDLPDQEAVRVWTGNRASVVVATNLVVGTPRGRYPHPGIRVRDSRNVFVVNNTISEVDIGLAIEQKTASTTVRNNLVGGSRLAAFFIDPTSAIFEDHNLFHGMINGLRPSPTTVRADPLFVSPLSGDYRLAVGSPAIDRGLANNAAGSDLDGRTRPLGRNWDIGAYEMEPEGER